VLEQQPDDEPSDDGWSWEMPPTVIDDTEADTRHQDVVQAAMEGRYNEAAQLAAIGERKDIATFGINSTEAAKWLVTRAQVADLSGDRHQAAQLRATVTRMGKNLDWFEPQPGNGPEPEWYRGPDSPPEPSTPPDEPGSRIRRRVWPYVATAAALSLAIVGGGQMADTDQQREDRTEKAEAFKGRSGASMQIDGVDAYVVAQWNSDRTHVVVQLRSYFDRNAKYLRIDADGQTAIGTQKDRWYPEDPEIALPVEDPLADVTVRVAVGGKTWKKGTRAYSRTIRLSPTGIAYDAETGERLPSDL
jgi:hypothetical protein